MAKSINKLRFFWLGKKIFLGEFLRVLINKGIDGIRRYLRLVNFTIDSERLLEHDKKGIIHFFIPPVPSRAFSRIIRSYNDTYVLKKKQIPLHNILISITKKCPFNCWYCSAANMPDNEISIADIEKIIITLKKWEICIIGLTGGEPLLRTDIDEIIHKYADEFTFIIFTSGYGLDLKRATRLKQAGLFYIAISLDDYDKNRNDRARGLKGAFEHSVKAIKNAKKAGLYTIIQSVITKPMLNNGQIWQFMNFVRELNADELLLLEPLGTGKLLNSDNGVFLNNQERGRLKSLHDIAARNLELPKINAFASIEATTKFGCGAGVQHAYIDTAGNFLPCNFLPISLGNMLEEPDLIYDRLVRYFGRPCNNCILTEQRVELQHLFKKGLPIPFKRAKDYLEQRSKRIKSSVKPRFYELMGTK